MATKEPEEQRQRADEELRETLLPGVKLLRTLEGHWDAITSVAFDPQGKMLASGGRDRTVKLWQARSGTLLRTLEGHRDAITSVIFDPQDGTLASGSRDNTVKLWVVAAEVDLISQRLISTQEEKRTVKTLLLAGEKKTSLPPLMWDGTHADFREESAYFTTAFDLILSLYQLPPNHPAVADLRSRSAGQR